MKEIDRNKRIWKEIRNLQRQEHAILDHIISHRYKNTKKMKHDTVSKLKKRIEKLKQMLV